MSRFLKALLKPDIKRVEGSTLDTLALTRVWRVLIGRDWVVNQSETVERLGKSRNSVHGRRSLAKPRHL